jgi:hypothetical protein
MKPSASSLLKALGSLGHFPAAACYLREFGAEIILIKGATPIPFKLLTLTAGFIQMPLFDFLWSSMLSRAFQFMLVGISVLEIRSRRSRRSSTNIWPGSARVHHHRRGRLCRLHDARRRWQKPGDKCSGVTTMEQVFQRT